MRLLALLCLVGLTFANPGPGFRYAYRIPQAGEGHWSQFNERSDDHHAWGYEFPGRAHFESKDDTGVVKGSFGYVDANGSPRVWKYSSHPNDGFQVDIGTGPALPQASSGSEGAPAPSVYNLRNENLSPFTFSKAPLTFFRAQQVEDSISPLLKQAASAGFVVAAGSNLIGTPQYAVNPEVAEEINGVSALAEHFGAIPVAAVHDAQSRPSFGIPKSAFAPVLVHQEEPDFTLYTLEVPIQ